MIGIEKLIKITDEEKNQLRQNFIKKLDDPKFVRVINPLNLDDEILMKYTSSLEDCALEYDHCQNCSGLSTCKNKINGYLYAPKVDRDNIIFEYVACPYQIRMMEDTKYKENIKLFETPKSLTDASMKNVHTDDKNRVEVIKYFKYFIDHYYDLDKPKGVYLYGSFGTGKSYLIAALFNELAKKDIRSAIVYVPEFLRVLKASFDSDYEDKYNYIKNVPVLLLDDIGAENLTAWSRDEILGTILQYRMDEKLPTFFTSNLDVKQLEEHFSITTAGTDKIKARRIIERINYLSKDIKLASENRRK